MRRYDRRRFLALAGGGAAALAVAAACGDDDEDGAGETPTASGASPQVGSPAATAPAVTPGGDIGAAQLRWFGQSMFLLTSPGATRVLLDPFGDIGYALPPPVDATATTITHEHPDHNNDSLAISGSRIMRGLTPDGYLDIDEAIGDVRIRTVRTFHDDTQGTQRGRNAVFVFETAGLRIAHFGDLGHQLDDAQVSALGGPVDVAMVPVGGVFTIDADGATALVQQLQPKLVFPMHYKTDRTSTPLATVDAFLQGKTVRRAGSTTLRLDKAALPAETETFVLEYE